MFNEFSRRWVLVFAAAALSLTSGLGAAQTNAATGIKTVVLVHGAFADGSSWRKVIPLLQAKGLAAVAVQNPLTSLADDVAAVRRAVDLQEGPVILVGHSWGGAVITEAGINPKVAGLVYVAAVAPDEGQSVADLLKSFPPMPASKEIKPAVDGFLTVTTEGMVKGFAHDLPVSEAKVMAATAGLMAANAFEQKVTAAAWKTKPSWYIVASQDRALSPDLQRSMARNIKATTITLPTSHVPMLSKPARVAAVIVEAANEAAVYSSKKMQPDAGSRQ